MPNPTTTTTQTTPVSTPTTASTSGDSLSDPLGQDSLVTPPANFKKKFSTAEAAENLHKARSDGAGNTVVASWIGYLLQKNKPQAGPVTSTYVSSFDTAKGGFSASRTLPEVPDLVVHGHYKRNPGVRDAAALNSAQVKWSDDEAGSAPPGQTKLPKGKEPEVLGSNHADLAINAWENNPKRHEMRQEAEGKKAAKQPDEAVDLDWLFG